MPQPGSSLLQPRLLGHGTWRVSWPPAVLAALALSAAPASAELAGPPVAPHLPFQVGDLAVLAIALILVLAAAVWTLFVTGFWIRRSRREHERERQRELQLDLALNNISQGLCMFDAHAKIV